MLIAPAAPEWHPEQIPDLGDLRGVRFNIPPTELVDEKTAAAWMHANLPGSTTSVWFAGHLVRVTAVDRFVVFENELIPV